MDTYYLNLVIHDIDKKSETLLTRKVIYKLPNKLVGEYRRDLSESAINKISDHLTAYLGLTKKIKVSFSGEIRDGWAGVYTSSGIYNKEIKINKKTYYNEINVIAILIHELVHLLIDEKQIENKYFDKEVFTDILAIYLGFGHILYKGYYPIVTKVTRTVSTFTGDLYDVEKHKIGYIDTDSIVQTIAIVSKYKKISYYQLFYFLKILDFIKLLYFRLIVKRGV